MMATDDRLFRGRDGDADAFPVDLAAVQADDALLNTLGRPPGVDDAELARVLVAWRREMDTEPIGQLVDLDTAVATVGAARKSVGR